MESRRELFLLQPKRKTRREQQEKAMRWKERKDENYEEERVQDGVEVFFFFFSPKDGNKRQKIEQKI